MKLNLPVLLRTHLQIQGASGSGKSWLVRLLAEQLFGKVPVIIIDQEGEYATLREKFDYILVGKGGETPAQVQSAAFLSQRLLQLQASAVVDLYDLDIPTRKTWIRKFFEGVMAAPKQYWRPTVFIIDEAHDFIPEKLESECGHILASAISKGRKRGFAFICATQRLSKLNKDVASELQNVLIGKTWLDIDRERGASALGIYSKQDKEEFYESVKRLGQGEFYAQGAALSLDRILFKTGEVSTTHPDSSNVKNKKKWLVPPPTPKAVAAMLSKLSDLPKEAELEAQTVSELKHTVAELRRQLKVQPKTVLSSQSQAAGDGKAMERLQAQLKTCQADLETHKIFAKTITQLLKKKNDLMSKAVSYLLEGTDVKFKIPEVPKIPEAPKYVNAPHAVAHISVSVPAKVYRPKVDQIKQTDEGEQGGINNKQRDILRALAEFKAIGRDTVPRNWVAHRAGASHRSSAFANNISNLRSRGFIEYTGDGIVLTDNGQAECPAIDSPMSTQDMLHSCLKMLSNKQAAILQYLHGIYPEEATREVTAESSGASVLSSAFANNVSSLKSAGMIIYTSARGLKAADWLFID